MKAQDRREWIVNELYRNKKVQVSALAQTFGVSEETVRRDLDKLEKEGLAQKNYGGAVLNAPVNRDPSYASRHDLNLDAKRRIAEHVLALVQSGDSVMADTSSTAFEALRLLTERREGLTLITNSLVALSAFQQSGHRLIGTGGTLGASTSSFVGPDAARTIERYNADVALLGCKALSMHGGICDSNEAEAELKLLMRRQANKVILLADHSKFDRLAFIRLFDFGEIDFVVTDRKPAEEWTEFLRGRGVTVVVGEQDAESEDSGV
ncbi:DeoR/GlpR family DNA-binding transcription regulator [Saccharibacillus sp. CPCC 101409]|uniref:DeoR/GlpR family DNA-binding transcription regulator n=1 Tax=Saccharibacillus sp. CPCC 101409 TaxID=3058041 RepID=UPI00267143D9|nr:DeoR/GlpR family DNA-binding transcription regulator [Saccharibacillus sp. CPCC 101409]MDO3413377.1 DeoR/GlpR family DNA-binding transcription regulator [Saccharibacillus sp. CPCC 101409]